MTPNNERIAGRSPRPPGRTWVPWSILALASILVTYSVDSFLRLPQQLGISQQCRMSRMRPAYIDHTANLEPFSPSGLWRKYRLYLYRERDFDPMDLPSGSPALFVPGNAGSYGQVRSVASSASRQFYKEHGSGERRDEWKDAPVGVTHTDWYTLDFNEDFSAFSGSTLIEQATFINEVLAYLGNRYASPPTRSFPAGERNTTVPILAHSMGGIAARLTAHLPNHPHGSVDTIVTLSTPHAYPPVPFDRSVENVYSLINQPVLASESASTVPPLLVSVAGGLLDTQLPSDSSSLTLARIGESVAPSRISTYTTSLPSLWSSVDHLAVMWCDQLRERIARGFLLDMMAYGRVADERSAGGISGKSSVLRRRRELWRRALSLFDVSDAGNGEIGPMELIASKDSLYEEDSEPFVVDRESPTFVRPITGPESALNMDEANFVFRVPAELGEDDEELHAFELITNLCTGWNPSSGMGIPIPQPVEIVVQTCTNSPDSFDPVGKQRTDCELVMPWQWELIPPSLLPRSDLLKKGPGDHFDPTLPENKPFPDAEEVYHVPGLAFQRLRLDATLLKRRRVDWIRVERKTESGMFVHQKGLKSFVRGGWMRQADGHIEKHGSSLLLTAGENSPVRQHHQDPGFATTGATPIASEWILKGYGSALLARRIEIVFSQCLLENLAIYTLYSNDETQHSTDPSFSPFLHVSNRATGDSRWYPQFVTPQLVRNVRNKDYKGEPISFPLSLHGNAPFMPPARASLDEVRVQLWSDQALLRPVPGKSLMCKSSVDSIRLSVDWKASAGLVLLRYRFILAAWLLGLLSICIGLSWLAWATDPDHTAFPAPLTSIMRPTFRTPFLRHKIDPLLGLLACLTGALLVVDSLRLALYNSMPSAQSSGPASSLLGMVLGLNDHSSSVGLVPCFLAVSYAALLVVVAAIQWTFRLTAAPIARCGMSRKLDWVGAATASSDPLRWNPRSIAGLAMLLLSVVLFVPHQFVFLCMFLLQMLNTLRAQLEHRSVSRTVSGVSASARSHESRFNQHLSIFIILALLLPQKASFLVTWVRNLTSVGITTPKTIAAWMDHNVLDVAPIVVLVWIMAGGRMLEPPRSSLEAKAIALGFGTLGWYGLVWGIRYTYRTYDAFNALCVLLALCHWRSRRSSKGMGRHASVQSARHGSKDSDETLGMLSDDANNEGRNGTSSKHGPEEYELQAGSSSGQLPIYHLALPVSIAEESSAAPTAEDQSMSIPSISDAPEGSSHSKIADAGRSTDKLDQLIAEYLEVLNRYQQVRKATSDSFSRGYLKLSRAKMEYGPSRLSSNSYDSRLLAELRATVCQDSSELTDAGSVSKSPRSEKISVKRIVPDYSHLVEDGILIADTDEKTEHRVRGSQDNTASEGLRRRTGPSALSEKDPKVPGETSDSLPSTSSTETKPVTKPDALSQFGGLPTASLRGAQKELKTGLDQALGVAEGSRDSGLLDLTRRLHRLSEEIMELREVPGSVS